MADMYNTTISSSSSAPEPDDISLFLHQILLRSSSSPSPSYSLTAQKGTAMQSTSPSRTLLEDPHRPIQSSLLSGFEGQVTDRISTAKSSSGLNLSCGAVFSSSGGYFPESAMNVSSFSVGTIDNDPDDYECESEEGFETLVEEVPAKPVPPRNSSKRSRAAEVHNLSEKRRRSRINEKMKALQKLIPNSNKTDKASMLDEAIDYLKQLQLQVQMLTMRNGLSLYPMCLPGVLQPAQLSQVKMGFCEGNGPLNIDRTSMLPVNQETLTSTLFNIPNQSTNPTQLLAADLSSIINPETTFGMESSIQDHIRPFQLHVSSEVKEICREDMLPCQQVNVDHCQTNLLELEMGAKATVSIPFDTQTSDHVRDNSLEACILGTGRPENVLLSDLECDPILAPCLNGIHTGRSAPKGDIKTEKTKLLTYSGLRFHSQLV